MEADSSGSATATVEHLCDREAAAVLVSNLHREFLNTENNALDGELKEVVEQALLDADMHGSVPLSNTLWAQLRGMSRRIWDDQTEGNWIRRHVRALKLSLSR